MLVTQIKLLCQYIKKANNDKAIVMKTHDYQKHAIEYSALGIEGTYYLAFRDIPELLKKHVKGTKALDYGCGPGRSSLFLKSLGFDTVGVDISNAMLEQAKLKDSTGEYYHIESGQLPFEDASFDLIFSSFVFLEISSLAEIKKVLAGMKRVLKETGFITLVTASMEAYKTSLVSFSHDFPENQRLMQSGDTVKLLIRGTGIILYDYYWTEQDYTEIFNALGLGVREIHKPLGQANDRIEWIDEDKIPPMLIYVLDKQSR
jgi:ubiquinone/menaquinone biosynthesis C-methylase UbiE